MDGPRLACPGNSMLQGEVTIPEPPAMVRADPPTDEDAPPAHVDTTLMIHGRAAMHPPFDFPLEQQQWNSIDSLTWLLAQHRPDLPAVLDFFGFTVRCGEVKLKGELQETLDIGRFLVSGLIVRQRRLPEERLQLYVQKRKTGNTHRLDVCCRAETKGAETKVAQLGSQTFSADAEGKFNQFLFIHTILAWRCVMLSAAHDHDNNPDSRFPDYESVQTLCSHCKKFIADVQLYGPE